MSRYGHCKGCWWHDNVTNFCFAETPIVERHPTSYCPDYLNRRKENKEDTTLNEWIEKQELSRITPNKCCFCANYDNKIKVCYRHHAYRGVDWGDGCRFFDIKLTLVKTDKTSRKNLKVQTIYDIIKDDSNEDNR